MPARKPSSGKRASKKTVKATETKFGKAARVAAQKGGKKPMAWQQSEAPKRAAYVPPVVEQAAVASSSTPAAGKGKAGAASAPPSEMVLNKIGSAAVEKATGRGWESWLKQLDADDARRMTHKEIVAHLRSDYRLDDWWCQMVTVGYEQARGMRQPGEKPDGFAVSVTRTLDATASDVFRAFNDPTRRDWSHERLYSVRTAVAPRMLRLGMPDETVVTVSIMRKGNVRTTVTVDQSKMADAAAAERARQAWKQALERMAMMLDE